MNRHWQANLNDNACLQRIVLIASYVSLHIPDVGVALQYWLWQAHSPECCMLAATVGDSDRPTYAHLLAGILVFAS